MAKYMVLVQSVGNMQIIHYMLQI